MLKRLSVLLLSISAIQPSHAHHAFAADYEAGKAGAVEGTITEVIYKNPHARYYIDVATDDGDTETWDLQTMNLMMLGRVGWTKNTLQVGDKIKVEGILGRDNTRRMSISVVTHEDGRVISPQRGISETNAQLDARSASGEDSQNREFTSIASNISAGAYELEDSHAYLSFSYDHMGLSRPQIQFSEFDATLNLDGNDMRDSRVSILIDAASIVAGSSDLEEFLRGPDYLDVENHPNIEFMSTGYEEISASTGILSGELTVVGTSQPVRLNVTINAAEMNQFNRREMIGVTATGSINRSDFGMTDFAEWISDELLLNIQVEFQKAREAATVPGR